MANENGVVIPEEMLESISGGALDDVSKQNIRGIVHLFKTSGCTYEALLKALDYLRIADDADEIFALVDECWNA